MTWSVLPAAPTRWVCSLYGLRARKVVPHLTNRTDYGCLRIPDAHRGFLTVDHFCRLGVSNLQRGTDSASSSCLWSRRLLGSSVGATVTRHCRVHDACADAWAIHRTFRWVMRVARLGGQLAIGIWGIYRGATRRAGLLDDNLANGSLNSLGGPWVAQPSSCPIMATIRFTVLRARRSTRFRSGAIFGKGLSTASS